MRRRWLIGPLKWLAAGVGITYLVAWVSVVVSTVSLNTWTRVPTLGEDQLPQGLGQRSPACILVRRAYDIDTTYAPAKQVVADVYRWEVGWPWRAVVATVREEGTAATPRMVHDALAVVSVPADPANSYLVRHRPLAIRPMWPGFAGCVLVFGAAVAVLDAFMPAARRWWRRRRGLCTGCGYDIHGRPENLPCPECGRVEADSRDR